ncbi:MAG TPA: hypothetical protein VIP46_04350 [Pyrinomonadaceae bacterium]
MKNRSPWARLGLAAAVLILLSAAAPNAFAGCEGRQPGPLVYELKDAVLSPRPLSGAETYAHAPWWQTCLFPRFDAWVPVSQGGGGSQNLPVVAAGIGLYRTPLSFMRDNSNTTTSTVKYTQWWVRYLAGQLGDLGQPSPETHLRYFKGTESFSATYDGPVVTTVVAVRYWAQKNKTHANAEIAAAAGQLDGLARRYLRANWAIYGMAAGTGPTAEHEVDKRAPTLTPSPTPRPNVEYYKYAPIRDNTFYTTKELAYSGHFLALPGARYTLNHRVADDRMPLYDRAIQYTPAKTNENFPQKELLNLLQSHWGANFGGLSENLYALTAADRADLNTLRDFGSNAARFLPWLANVRTARTFRILGWPGFRAALMNGNPNWATPCMYGVAYDGATRLASYLFPWGDNGPGPAEGWARIEKMGDGGMKMIASNEGSTDIRHPVKIVEMDVPRESSQFHLVLSQNAEPYLEGTAPEYFPPPEPPERDWPRNP